MYKRARKWILLPISLLVVGCISQESPVLHDTSCEPPCWHEIEPGITNQQELIDILINDPMVDPKTISSHGEQWKGFNDIVYFHLKSGEEVRVYLLEDKVSMISFYDNLRLSFGQTIDQFGEPKKIIVFNMYGPAFLFGEALHTIVHAIEPEKGISYEGDFTGISIEKPFKISPSTKIDEFEFFDPDSYLQLLEQGMFSDVGLEGSRTLELVQEWKGYGEYKSIK